MQFMHTPNKTTTGLLLLVSVQNPFSLCQILLGHMDAAMVASAQGEAALFRRLDHPNCHYMIGAKTTVVRLEPFP